MRKKEVRGRSGKTDKEQGHTRAREKVIASKRQRTHARERERASESEREREREREKERAREMTNQSILNAHRRG